MCRARNLKSGLAATFFFLLAAGLVDSAQGAVRFDVIGSPTEVIHTGRSEVLGSINLVVRGTGNVTGTSAGGPVQIEFTFEDPALQIDNTTTSGIRLFFSPAFSAAGPSIVGLGNRDVGGRCSGYLTLNIQPGAAVAEGDYLRIDGIRGRIDTSIAITPGTDLFVKLQSANDPAATYFSLDRLRMAKSFKGLMVEVASNTLSYEIRIVEGFARAFVDRDAGDDGVSSNDRTDSGGNALGAPTNSTQIQIRLDGIPDGITDVIWPAISPPSAAGAVLYRLSKSFAGSSSTAIYSYEAVNQVGSSDLVTETFSIAPGLEFGGGHCNTDNLTVSAALAPAVAAASSCELPSDAVDRPRFREVYEITLQSLSTYSAMAGSPGFTLRVLGSGFVQGSTVLWNGSARSTSFISRTELTAAIPASDLAKPATAYITVQNPAALGGSVSNALAFEVGRVPLSLVYPRLMAINPDLSGKEAKEYTGIALVNLSGRQAKLKLTVFDSQGSPIKGSDLANPATLTLNDGQQTPVLVTEVFGPGLMATTPPAWMKVEGNVPQVAGFFLTFDGNLTRLDGADVSSNLMTSFVFPEIAAQGRTQIHIANPNDDAALVTIELMKSDGSTRFSPVTRRIEPGGTLASLIGDLFPGVTPDASDYIRVNSSRGVAAFEYFCGSERDYSGMNGQDAVTGASVLYSPQYVVGGRDWNSALSIVNLSAKAGDVTLRFIGDNGTQLGSTKVMQIAAMGKIRITDQSLFLPAGDTLNQGYLEISANGIKILGDVVFCNASRKSFASALPLVTGLREKMIFSHVASNSTYYTGLALLNPDERQAPAVIQVFDSKGQVVASKMEIIPPRARVSRLITEYFPDLAQREIISGYIIVTGIRNLAAFALFGTRDQNQSVLSAIPAQSIP